jgi:nucleotidyltransferase/DNA polymerase involved in DNA repair
MQAHGLPAARPSGLADAPVIRYKVLGRAGRHRVPSFISESEAMAEERVIIHVDMDAFFAAVEQRDNPALRGKPVVVGADPKDGKGRGVVSTASYEARAYGIHSAQPISQAYRCCPHAVFLPVDMEKYGRESDRVRQILSAFTPQLEFVSIDEAHLDVSGSLRLFGGKRELARQLQQRIERETGLTASLGVAPNKLVAKIASDLQKPRGLVVVEPEEVEQFLRPLEVRRLPGVGPKLQQALTALGVRTIGDLADRPREELQERFGAGGLSLWDMAHGIDDSPVEEEREVKSIGHEHTFEVDTNDAAVIRATLMELCERTARRLRKAGLEGRTVTTKVRFEDFTTVTRRQTLEAGTVAEAAEIFRMAEQNHVAAHAGRRKVRLVGVTVSGLQQAGKAPGGRQTRLFGAAGPHRRGDIRLRLARAEDAVKDRFGEDAIRRGASLRRPEPDEDGD